MHFIQVQPWACVWGFSEEPFKGRETDIWRLSHDPCNDSHRCHRQGTLTQSCSTGMWLFGTLVCTCSTYTNCPARTHTLRISQGLLYESLAVCLRCFNPLQFFFVVLSIPPFLSNPSCQDTFFPLVSLLSPIVSCSPSVSQDGKEGYEKWRVENSWGDDRGNKGNTKPSCCRAEAWFLWCDADCQMSASGRVIKLSSSCLCSLN